MTASEVVERIRKNLGVPWNEQTYRDTFKAGDPATEVQGIATTFMATLDLIQRAHAAGMNMVVTHEPTFWSDRDTVTELGGDPIYRFKVDFCNRNHMVVWRFHDHWHARKPDMEFGGLARALGWEGREAGPNQHVYKLPPTTLGALAADVKRRLGARAMRVVGDPRATVSTVAMGVGYNIPRVSGKIDVAIGGENPETGGAFDDTEYVMDAAFFGGHKGQIILGHAISEEPGMEDCATWLRTFISEVPIRWIQAGEPFWAPK
ncbi:MAG TPA: Nif3-like dinuclear metal center hexameric protein [Bryobacteraceae bacterium]|nr:Nif3-like dinuclear metal center hexameric protein [Bryobacteraceae bacterium]